MPCVPGETSMQACPNCATLIDVRQQEPLARIDCPACGTPMRVNRQLNQFSIVEHLGTGGVGEVYKALDRRLNRLVALKLLRKELSTDDKYIDKLEEEARITASINHPHVVKVFSFDQDDGQYYIAMELVDKGSLDDLMQLQNRVAEMQVLQVGRQVASGLQAAHDRGMIHRDVKPGNILFADAHTAKITDFGLALLAGHEAESGGEIWGTPYYIAPEKLNHEPEDFRSDIYSLGGTLFHAVAGRPPFEAESAPLVALKHLKSRAVSLQAFAPDVSGETAYVINRMLAKDPGQRYGSYPELIDHLQYAIDTLAASTARPRAAKPRVVVRAPHQNNLAGILTLLLLVLMLAGGVAAYVYRERIFGPAIQPAEAQVNPAAADADKKVAVEALYEEARHQLAEGQYAAAQASFAALATRSDLPQPLASWNRLHEGMAALLNHQPAEARHIFASLENAGPYSRAESQRSLAGFFVEVGRNVAEGRTIPADAVKLWSNDTFEAEALLLFALADWERGDFEPAAALFREYQAGRPPAPYQWISDYEPIARRCLHDYGLYTALEARRRAATSPASPEWQAEYNQARGELQTTGKMVEAFFNAENQWRQAAAVTPTPTSKAASKLPVLTLKPATAAKTTPFGDLAAATNNALAVSAGILNADAETVRWQAARDSYVQMLGLYHFDEAAAVIGRAELSNPDLQRARDLLKSRAQQLIAFKRELVADINTRGYPQAVVSRRNVAFPRGIVKASANSFEAATPYGTIAVPWTDFAPKALLGIGSYFADSTADVQQAAARRWLLATFALETGQPREARELASRAAQDRPEYRAEMAPFLASLNAPMPLAASSAAKR